MIMKRLLLVFMLMNTTAHAESSALSLAIPSPSQNYQSDKFRAGELDCSNAIGSATNLEFGVTSIINKGGYDSYNNYFNDTSVGDIGIYARITIPLGAKAKSRIDCNELYQLELKKKRLEVLKLEQELRALEKLKFEE